MLGKCSSLPLGRCCSGCRNTIEGDNHGAAVGVRTQGITGPGLGRLLKQSWGICYGACVPRIAVTEAQGSREDEKIEEKG